MRRSNARTVLALCCSVLVGLFAVACGTSEEPATGGSRARPNLLLLVSDDQGTVLGCYGPSGVATPRLDALSAAGTRFTRAYAPTGVCTPSRTSIYTGLMPVHHGATGFGPVRDGVTVWGEHFRSAGYRTGLIGKLGAKPIARFPFDFVARSNRADEDARSLQWHVDQLDAFLAPALDGSDDRPWVLVVNFRDSHWPFPTDGAPFSAPPLPPQDPATVGVPPTLLDVPAVRAEIARYHDGLRRLDATAGAIVDRLDERGLAERTVGVFTSDNGPPFPFAKTTLYEAGIHMPLLVWNHGTPGVRDELVSLVDILPTFLDLAGQPVEGLDGRSMRPLLEADDGALAAAPWRGAIFGSHDSHRVEPDVPARSVCFGRSGRWKYIRTWGEGLRFQNLVMQTSDTWRALAEAASTDPVLAARLQRFVERPAEELYDLESDPYELVNLAGRPEHAARTEMARDLLRTSDWIDLPDEL